MKAASPPAPILNQTDQRGFTLLEVLLTSLLASIVMVALWTLSDIYLRLFASGSRKIEETKLVRGLTERFDEDLSHVIQIPVDATLLALVPRSPSALGSTPRSASLSPDAFQTREAVSATTVIADSMSSTIKDVPNFGLFGTSNTLRLIVLESDPRAAREPTELADVLPQPGRSRIPFAAEIKTVEYLFRDPMESGAEGDQQPGGLVRRKWAWETWIATRQTLNQGSDTSNYSRMMPDNLTPWTSEDTLALESNEDNVLHEPNVVGIEFNYFDGDTWLTEWNSWEQRKLPVLVEVLMTIQFDRNSVRSSRANSTATDTRSDASGPEDGQATSGTTYRQIIHLPLGDVPPAPGNLIPESNSTDFATTTSRIPGLPVPGSAVRSTRASGARRP